MSVEVVNTITGERIDLRFVGGFRITGNLSPEMIAELEQVRRFRAQWAELVFGAFGLPAELLMRSLIVRQEDTQHE